MKRFLLPRSAGRNRLPSCRARLARIGFAILLLLPLLAIPGTDIATLRKQVEKQRALIREQGQQLKEQEEKIDRQTRDLDELSNRLDKIAGSRADAPPAPTDTAPQAVAVGEGKGAERPPESWERDMVGDLNAPAVMAGEFPGSFRIPGPGKISMAIGGFIKTAAIEDTKAEGMGADFLPAYLGTKYPDKNGGFSVDATITRLFIDGRAPVPSGKVRGYLEWDLNSANDGTLGTRWRLAYGTWTSKYGTLLAGQNWSTFMDLKILPEGLTEPTVSGVIFNRQGQVRWSQALSPEVTYHIAIEDPNSNDFFTDQPAVGKTSIPDGILGVEYDRGGLWHLRLNGIVRRLNVTLPDGSDEALNGWGLALTGHLYTIGKDRAVFSGVYGEALGRYLLGITSDAGAALDPATGNLKRNRDWGGMVSYIHHWTDKLRSTGMVGHARADLQDWQPGSFFKSSTYAAANLMWRVQPYLTLGAEYGYGRRENKDGSDLDNHRIAIGIQLF